MLWHRTNICIPKLTNGNIGSSNGTKARLSSAGKTLNLIVPYPGFELCDGRTWAWQPFPYDLVVWSYVASLSGLHSLLVTFLTRHSMFMASPILWDLYCNLNFTYFLSGSPWEIWSCYTLPGLLALKNLGETLQNPVIFTFCMTVKTVPHMDITKVSHQCEW